MTESTTPTRGPGRPSVADARRRQIVDAFIELVCERGHHDVTIAEVADRAGVHRNAIRHFVGTRSDLVVAGLDRIDDELIRSFDDAVGDDPTLETVLDHLFGAAHIWSNQQLDDAYSALMMAATDDEDVRQRLRTSYEVEVRWLTGLLDAHSEDDARAAAYQIVCLAEQNSTMQRIGFDAALSDQARSLAGRIAGELAD